MKFDGSEVEFELGEVEVRVDVEREAVSLSLSLSLDALAILASVRGGDRAFGRTLLLRAAGDARRQLEAEIARG